MIAACQAMRLQAGARVLVDGLELQVRSGERWAVLGPNGAGKSTLLATLAGLRQAEAGRIELAQQPMQSLSIAQLAELRALVTDRWIDPFASSVLETVLTARYRFAKRGPQPDAQEQAMAQQLLALLDCAALAQRNVRSLSRGERQRVALATALAQETPLLLLDEPTAHQDPRHQALVLQALAAMTDRTVIASLHDINAAARFATHALLLFGDGRWQAGAAQAVMTSEALSALFGTAVQSMQTGSGSVFYLAGNSR